MTWIASFGQQAASTAANGAIGIGMQRLGANYDRRKQVQQQQALMEVQMRGEKEMMDYQNQQQLDFWNKTSYGAQLANMKKAGLSPGLMYGGGPGAGGTTGGGVPSLGGGSAQYNDTAGKGMNNGMAMMNAAQLGLIDAQTKNVQADTANKQGDTLNKPKIGANLDASTANLIANTGNAKADTALKNAQQRILQIQGNVAEESQDDAIQRIHSETIKAIQEAHMAMNDAGISDATIEAKITQLKGAAVGVLLTNELTAAQTGKAQTGQAVDRAQISKMAQDVAQGWEGLSIRMKEAKVKGIIEEFEAQFKGHIGAWRMPDARSMARQIDEILGISPKDFKKNNK